MGVFDQNKGRLPAAGQSMGPVAAPQAVQGAPQMGVAQGMPASQITPPRLVDQNLAPPGAATPMPPQMGQRPYAPLNFGAAGRPQLPPGVDGQMQRPDMQRPMPPQAMGGMAPGNFDPGQLRQKFQDHLAQGGQLPPIPQGMDPQVLRQGMAKLGLDPSHLDNAVQRGPALANALMYRR